MALHRTSCTIAAFFLFAAAATSQENMITHHATGTFDVKIVPQKPDNQPAETAKLGRMSIDKQFHGDINGTSQGEMLSLMTETKGSGVYVAIELVNASLQGRSGSFALHHTGVMTRGAPNLTVTVVPDSGTDQLTGITGTFVIRIEAGGKHFYDFDYTLPDTPPVDR